MKCRMERWWLSLWYRLAAQGDGRAVYNDLVRRYSEPHRAYHTLVHIEHCLNELGSVLGSVALLAADIDTVELALWYHDAVYDTETRDNEEKSAALVTEMLREASILNRFGPSVTNLIMATRHMVKPMDSDARLLVDIDLAILGQPEDKFDEYERQIRKEYEWVEEDEFASGRAAILMIFQNRPTIYSTRFFRDKYEKQARLNITRSITKLLS